MPPTGSLNKQNFTNPELTFPVPGLQIYKSVKSIIGTDIPVSIVLQLYIAANLIIQIK